MPGNFREYSAVQPAFDITAPAGLANTSLRTLPPLWRPVPVHAPCVLWFTGLSGAGKSTIAARLQAVLDDLGCQTARLDGDDVREGLCDDLGFSDTDRVENIRRVAHVASLMARSRLIVLVTLISPFQASRDHARSLVPAGQFLEVFVDAPLPVVQQRDTKGLYARARSGEALQLTGVQASYEEPRHPDVHLRSDRGTPDDACRRLLGTLVSRGVLSPHALPR
jgi:adenylyl-sulfate kinase